MGIFMATKGYFIITDISGYTEYFTRLELEHAHKTLQKHDSVGFENRIHHLLHNYEQTNF